MPAGIAFARDVVATEVLLGGEVVVRSAAERKVFRLVLAVFSKRVQVMKLEPVHLSAALTSVVDVRASPVVTLVHRATHSGRYVSAAPERLLGLL